MLVRATGQTGVRQKSEKRICHNGTTGGDPGRDTGKALQGSSHAPMSIKLPTMAFVEKEVIFTGSAFEAEKRRIMAQQVHKIHIGLGITTGIIPGKCRIALDIMETDRARRVLAQIIALALQFAVVVPPLVTTTHGHISAGYSGAGTSEGDVTLGIATITETMGISRPTTAAKCLYAIVL